MFDPQLLKRNKILLITFKDTEVCS